MPSEQVVVGVKALVYFVVSLDLSREGPFFLAESLALRTSYLSTPTGR